MPFRRLSADQTCGVALNRTLTATLTPRHQLLSASPRTKKALKLADKSSRDFMYLNRGDTATASIEGVPDAEAFVRTMEVSSPLSRPDLAH